MCNKFVPLEQKLPNPLFLQFHVVFYFDIQIVFKCFQEAWSEGESPNSFKWECDPIKWLLIENRIPNEDCASRFCYERSGTNWSPRTWINCLSTCLVMTNEPKLS